jgi:hypothetical protein
MGVELVITRIPTPSIRRLLAAHGIISPADAAAHNGSNSTTAAAGDAEDPEQQPLLQESEAAAAAADEGGSFCRVFDTLSGAARYAEDRSVLVYGGMGRGDTNE